MAGRIKGQKFGGVTRSAKRLEIEKLDLISMLSEHSSKFLCIKYSVSKDIFHKVLNEQLEGRNIGFENNDPIINFIDKNKNKGAWMSSDCRDFMVDNGLMDYQIENVA